MKSKNILGLGPWLALLVSLVLFACGNAGTLVKRGDELSKAGLHEEALSEYEQAAEESPDDPEIKKRLEQTRKLLADAANDDGLAQLEAGQVADALVTFKRAISLYRGNPAYKKNLKKAALHRMAEGNKAIEAGKFAQAIKIFKSVSAELPRLLQAKQGLTDARNAWADSLLKKARDFSKRGLHGNSLIAIQKLVKLVGTYGDSTSIELTARERLTQAAAFGYAVRPGKTKRRQMKSTAKLVQSFGQASVPGCPGGTADSSEPRLTLTVVVEKASFRNQKETSRGEQKYQSGTRPVDNPAYGELEGKIEQARERVSDLEKQLLEDEKLVEQMREAFADAGPDDDEASLRKRFKKVEKDQDDHRTQLGDTRNLMVELHNKLSDTPRKLAEPVYDTRQYKIFKVTRTAEVKALIHARGEEGQALLRGESIEASAEVVDSYNKAQVRYGIKADNLEFAQSDEDLLDQAMAKAAGDVAKLIGEQCKGWQDQVLERARQARTAAELEAIEDFVLYLFISSDKPPADLVEFLKAKRNFTDVAALRGARQK